MSKIDLIRMGIQNLWRRKLRTFLTVLGVIIGTSSIIVMLSLGFGMSQSNEELISQWGSLTTINVHKGWSDIPGKKVEALDDKAVATFKSIPNVEAVSPAVSTYGIIINGRYQAHMDIKGIDPDAMEAFGYTVSEGRLLNHSDDLAVVFGAEVFQNFHDPKSRVYKEPKLNLMRDRMTLTMDQNFGYEQPGENKPKPKEYKIKTVGIMEPGDDWETNYSVYMPLVQVQKLIKEQEASQGQGQQQPGRGKDKGYNQVNIKVNDMKNVQDVQKTIKDMGHEAYSLNDQLDSMNKQASVMQAVLGGIGAISLLVAAIGITNTMVMSIYERTKEIGVMKVIGASLKDIKRLFLFESALIGLLGGIFGVGFSYLLSFIANKFGSQFVDMLGMGMGGEVTKISIIPLWLVFAAMGFSSLIGVISGYYPAKRAMNLSALEAIRTE